MSREDITNFLSDFVDHYSSIILWTISSDDEGGTVNKSHEKTHECKIRVLVSGVSATWKPVYYAGALVVSCFAVSGKKLGLRVPALG